MEVNLTKDEKKLLSAMYRFYKQRRKTGLSKKRAGSFEDAHLLHKELVPDWQFDDVKSTCWQLKRSGMITCSAYSNIPCTINISDAGIYYMENRLKDTVKGTVKNIIDTATTFIP